MKKSSARAPRLTPRQERFAQDVAAGKIAASAYAEIYGVTKRQASANSARLIIKSHIKKRIAEIQATHAVANAVTVNTITEMLRTAYAIAIETKQASAASAAAYNLAKVHGLVIEKSQVDATMRRPASTPDAPEYMTEEEWVAQFGQGSANPEFDMTVTEAPISKAPSV